MKHQIDPANSWTTTFTGKRFDFIDPTAEMIDIRDIAHGLANTCRFSGQCRGNFNVAQHSVLVARHLPDPLKFLGLMHDSPEAFTGDLPKPMKRMLPEFEIIEARIWGAIATKYGLPVVEWPVEVKEQDNAALATERRDILTPTRFAWKEDEKEFLPWRDRIRPWNHDRSEKEFLSAFAQYSVRHWWARQHVRMFKPRFKTLVKIGAKRQTVRPTPKRECDRPKVGDRISLRTWKGKPYRSKQIRLRESIVTGVERIEIGPESMRFPDRKAFFVTPAFENEFALADGFTSAAEMRQWFEEQHGFPFTGILIQWE